MRCFPSRKNRRSLEITTKCKTCGLWRSRQSANLWAGYKPMTELVVYWNTKASFILTGPSFVQYRNWASHASWLEAINLEFFSPPSSKPLSHLLISSSTCFPLRGFPSRFIVWTASLFKWINWGSSEYFFKNSAHAISSSISDAAIAHWLLAEAGCSPKLAAAS